MEIASERTDAFRNKYGYWMNGLQYKRIGIAALELSSFPE
jgi:hypothetical protein